MRYNRRMVIRPHWGWWLAIGIGLSANGALALSDAAYGWWATDVTAVLSQPLLLAIFVAAWLLHLCEALYAWRLARRHGDAAGGWFVQTLLLGYPSLRLLRRRHAAAER